MSAHEIPITEAGLEKLQAELDELINVKRPAMAARIKAARELGDLKENAEYHDAKNDQGFMETKIQQLESQIRNARLITDVDTGVVSIGTSVRVWDADAAEELTYVITGPAEADPLEMRISSESPIGSALLGTPTGGTARVTLPRGQMVLEVREITMA